MSARDSKDTIAVGSGVRGPDPISRLHRATARVGEADCRQVPQPTAGAEPRFLLQQRGDVSSCVGYFAAKLPAGTVEEGTQGREG